MGSQLIQILVLAGVAVFLVLRLRSVLGTREGFEDTTQPAQTTKRKFEVIDGGGEDFDISNLVDLQSPSGKALASMKRVESGFSVEVFTSGARQAYEMILMAFENGDLPFLEQYLAPDVYDSFSTAITARVDSGLTVDATFIGVSGVKLVSAKFDEENSEAEITMKFRGELTSIVRNADGEVVEGDDKTVKKHSDVWTFARLMGGDNPNWLLVGTGA
ncbi:MAG: Tim44/TimA family putative adaptor protein [Paracoccaceae bacterium]|jgi:predicted lipid-binding transport protein (Tim44 family)